VAYLNFLYTPEGQEIMAKHSIRPRDSSGPREVLGTLPEI